MRKKNRVLLKISGEALMGETKSIHDNLKIHHICNDIKEVCDLGYELCLVIGGGNICRGSSLEESGIHRVSADHMGMLSTVINAIAIKSKLEDKGLFSGVMSAIPIPTVAEQYIREKAIRCLEKNKIVIFASGTGNPFFTTDTGAVLKSIEMNCSIVLKGTQVDGVYSKDPQKNIAAVKYIDLSYKDVINKNISIMDNTAIALAYDNKMPIKIFSIRKSNELAKVLQNKGSYTTIK